MEVLEHHAEQLLRELPEALASEAVSTEKIAVRLGMSLRTLRRRLAEHDSGRKLLLQ